MRWSNQIKDVKCLGGTRLRLGFDDGFSAELDLAPALKGRIFEPLRDPRFFRQVSLDGHTIAWPNDASLCPDVLRYWCEKGTICSAEEVGEAFAKDHPARPSMHEHLTRVIAHVRQTGDFSDLAVPELNTMPIPFFGNIETAQVLTVGVNPSATEFKHRNWPQDAASPDYLQLRLRNYFHLTAPKPHRWFCGWEAALNSVDGCAYRENAAHLDLSPRATKSMRSANADKFLKMVAGDLGIFFETLALCRRAAVMLMAGSVTGRFYINEFLKEYAPRFGFELRGDFHRRRGGGMTCRHTLVGARMRLPVFFFSCGPSYDPGRLYTLVSEKQNEISAFLNL